MYKVNVLMKILSGTSNPSLSKSISKQLKLKLINTNIKNFADGEFVDGNNNAIELYTYLNQSGLSLLQHYKIIDGGHYWFDLSVNGKNLDQLIWHFFEEHDND